MPMFFCPIAVQCELWSLSNTRSQFLKFFRGVFLALRFLMLSINSELSSIPMVNFKCEFDF